jgi:hypothetical protein
VIAVADDPARPPIINASPFDRRAVAASACAEAMGAVSDHASACGS